MSPRRLKLLLPMAAALSAAVLSHVPASAFSQFGSPQEGVAASRSKEGIIAVPLPPLPGAGGSIARSAKGSSGESAANPSTTMPAEDAPASATDAPAAEPGNAAPLSAGPAAAGEAVPPDAAEGMAPATLPAAEPIPDHGGMESAPPLSAANENLDPGAAPELPAKASAPVDVRYGDDGLPGPVRDLREKLMAIARSGDIEALRPYIETGEEATVLSFGGAGDDPIAFLKEVSGDGEGVEILAILLEVLESGHARVEAGTDNEIFVWPYFTQTDIGSLTKPQMVELFELVTAGDYEQMKAFGAYNFYRAGISPDGKLQFFVAGD